MRPLLDHINTVLTKSLYPLLQRIPTEDNEQDHPKHHAKQQHDASKTSDFLQTAGLSKGPKERVYIPKPPSQSQPPAIAVCTAAHERARTTSFGPQMRLQSKGTRTQ
mmetsp:Transcript_34416/g.79451  ORF Transcript_34416/g.79451 Transcript_34416/m.79451 type:complete len:107 (+) Transcript_34416:163-483(+)